MFESKINRGKVNGYAPLDSEGKVPLDKTYVGANGTSGTSGVNGSMGSSGQSGTSGIDGTNGTNGTSAFENIDITTFATTGSNQFYGNQSISGSVNISSSLVVSSTFVNSGNIEALNSDLIIDGGSISITGSLNVSGSVKLSTTNGSGDSLDLIIEQTNNLGPHAYQINASGSTENALFLISNWASVMVAQGTVSNPGDTSLFTTEVVGYVNNDGPDAQLQLSKSGSVPAIWVYDYTATSDFPGNINIGYDNIIGTTSGSLNIRNGNINLTGSLNVSGTLSIGGDVSAQSSETIGNVIEQCIFVNKKTEAFQYSSYNGGPQLSLDIEYQKPLTTGSGINTLAIGFPDLTVQTTAFLNNGVVSSSQQINNYNVFATTGSNTFNGEQTITGSLNVSSSLKISNDFYVDGNKQFNYASFSDLTIQSASADIAYPMKLNTTDLAEGFSVVSESRITATNSGTYNLQFSAQLEQTTNNAAEISIWFRKNGTNIPNSNTELTIEKISGGGKQVAAWNYILQLQSTEYVEIMWASTRSDTILHYHAVQSTPTRPATPSVIVTMTQIA